MFTVVRSIGYYEDRIQGIMRGRKKPVEITRIFELLRIGEHDLAQKHLATQAAARMARENGIKSLGNGFYLSLEPDAEPEPEIIAEPPAIVEVPKKKPVVAAPPCVVVPPAEPRKHRNGWQGKKTLRVLALEKLAAAPEQELAVCDLIVAAFDAQITTSEASVKTGISTMVRKGELESTRRGYVRLPQQKPTP